MKLPEPSPRNDYLSDHVQLLRRSLRRYTKRDLIAPGVSAEEAPAWLFHAPFAVVSHDVAPDPIFNYGNRVALELFEMSWSEFTSLPSRESAEPLQRRERARLLAEVSAKGFITDYAGVRISSSGRRFRITGATVWNLVDGRDRNQGQAATFDHWTFL